MTLAGVPIDFILFALTLLGVAVFHHRTLQVALTGMAVIALYKLAFGDFRGVAGLPGLGGLLAHEWVTLANLLGLLLGFALLADHFEKSGVTSRTIGRAASGCWSSCSCCPASWTTSRRR